MYGNYWVATSTTKKDVPWTQMFFPQKGSLKDISDCIRNHLIAWQHLAYRFELLKMKLFKLRPKHHSLDHLGSQVARTRINPRRVMSCWNDESFLGYLKKIGIKCHVKTILERLYQRYILGLALRWQETKKGLGVWKKKLWPRTCMRPMPGNGGGIVDAI